jgi:hypothetical protein
MSTALIAAITAVSKEKGLSDADRAHLKRWASTIRSGRNSSAQLVMSSVYLRFHQWQLELANKADDLADYYKWAEEYSGIAMLFASCGRLVN